MSRAKQQTEYQFKINVYNSISSLDKELYNDIVDTENPFLEYEFLEALEKSDCVGPHTTWNPRYIVLTDNDKIIGAITSYVKLDSYGEYIFDWEWARAFESSGLSYYPKLVVAIPFTPATGTRILVHSDYSFQECAQTMVKRLIQLSVEEKCSSVHFLYLTENEHIFLEKYGFLSRKTHQYHWKNRNYNSFDDFLCDMRSGRKKQIRKERKSLVEAGLHIQTFENDEIKEEHMDAIWEFYLDTHSRKWGSAYLNREFFDLMYQNFRHRLVFVMANDGNNWVGGTFNVVKNNRLFGRYWGTLFNYKNLHFECCFYRLIDYSIKNGIDTFEAGAQGEHKFLRGFAAVPTFSSHLIMHEGANNAISDHLVREKDYTDHIIKQYNRQSPLKYLYGK
ncbi:MAG: GNAT family N-acetyltransferase [Candidatus Dadabacteria bacterium]|nr:GNAT family N-acetyltransferase [Candidatus Dadabacteria bacterium]